MHASVSHGKTITILIPDLRGGGAERVSIDLAQAFNSLGHEVEFLLLNAEGEFLSEAERNFRIIDLNVNKIRQSLWPITQYLRSRKPDILIANMWPLTSVAVMSRILSRTKTCLLLVEHNTLSNQYSSWGAAHKLLMKVSVFGTYRFASRLAAVSKGSARDTARLAGLHPDRVAVIHNPIPQRTYPTFEAIARVESLWGIPHGQRILAVGTLKSQKNYPLLLRAYASLRRPSARLMILGSGDASALQRLAADLGIAERVIFPGFHVDPTPFYATSDLFVLSSDYEGFGNVIVEALAFGVPVVSTDCPFGPAEILDNGRWGRLASTGDAEALAREMDDALSNPTDREALKQRAADFAPEVAVRKYLDLLGIS
jgi:glycosyltransferase involved in cell wall biosynthesis